MDLSFFLENTLLGLRDGARRYFHTFYQILIWNRELQKGGVMDLSSEKLLPPHSFLAISSIWLVIGFRHWIGPSEFTGAPIRDFLAQTNVYLVIILMYLVVVLVSQGAVRAFRRLTKTEQNATASVYLYVAGWIYLTLGTLYNFSGLEKLIGHEYSNTKNIIFGVLYIIFAVVELWLLSFRILPLTIAVVLHGRKSSKEQKLWVGAVATLFGYILILTSAIAAFPVIDEILTQRKLHDLTVDCYTRSVDLDKHTGKLTISMILLSRHTDPYIVDQQDSFLRVPLLSFLRTNASGLQSESGVFKVQPIDEKSNTVIVLAPKTPQVVTIEANLSPIQTAILLASTNPVAKLDYRFSVGALTPKHGETIRFITTNTNEASGVEESRSLIILGKKEVKFK